MLWSPAPRAAIVILGLVAGGAAPEPVVVAVAPSGPTVPERLLRISASFAAPVEVLRVDLFRSDGSVIEQALMEQVLWSPDRRVATFLLDPGRVKTGLIAHDAAGWALKPGQDVTLRIAGRTVHTWRVVPGGCVVPDPAAWTIYPPKQGSSNPLTLVFPGPIDALSRDLIAVANASGDRVSGRTSLNNAERRWAFTPAAPWAAGTWQVVVHPRLESPCGDEPGEAFEHAAERSVGSARADLRMSFAVN